MSTWKKMAPVAELPLLSPFRGPSTVCKLLSSFAFLSMWHGKTRHVSVAEAPHLQPSRWPRHTGAALPEAKSATLRCLGGRSSSRSIIAIADTL